MRLGGQEQTSPKELVMCTLCVYTDAALKLYVDNAWEVVTA